MARAAFPRCTVFAIQSKMARSAGVLDIDPLRGGLDLGSDGRAGIFAAAAFEAADGPDRHVVVASDLAAQANAARSLRFEHIALRDRHFCRLAADELNPARRAASLSAAGVQLVDPGFFRQCQDQTLAYWHFEFADTLYG